MEKIIKKLCTRETISYLIFGVLTTLINIGVSTILVKVFQVEGNIASTIGIIISILFAYFTNRKMVFNSTAETAKEKWEEFLKFILGRSFTMVLEMAGDVDVWAFRYGGDEPASYGVLATEYHGYCQMRAFREHNCYGCNVDQTRFYEETPFRPDYLLGDFVQMIHPEIKLKGGMRYYFPVVGE